MAREGQTLEQWLRAAKVPPERLNDQQRAVLQAACEFLQHSHGDYSSSRMAGCFLLHRGVGLKVTQIARLVGISARCAFRHEKLSAMQVVQQIQHRFHGRPYGKLLPRHAGSIAKFLFTHPEATRAELLDFLERTWEFRISKVALWKFLKQYGLDLASLEEARQTATRDEEEGVTAEVLEARLPGGLMPVVPDRFFFANTQYAGAFLPASASPTTTVRSSGVS
jgi:transposase